MLKQIIQLIKENPFTMIILAAFIICASFLWGAETVGVYLLTLMGAE